MNFSDCCFDNFAFEPVTWLTNVIICKRTKRENRFERKSFIKNTRFGVEWQWVFRFQQRSFIYSNAFSICIRQQRTFNLHFTYRIAQFRFLRCSQNKINCLDLFHLIGQEINGKRENLDFPFWLQGKLWCKFKKSFVNLHVKLASNRQWKLPSGSSAAVFMWIDFV